MLKLKRVELQGFKSFCDRSELKFHGEGIAAIVGPNGCGKSNLADAINWVLGEQSAKSLRGARMEDVIFAGTRDRKPVGMAVVNLTLIDPTGGDPLAPAQQKTNGHAPIAGMEGVVVIEDVSSGVNGHSNGHGKGHSSGHADGVNGSGVNGAGTNGTANGKTASPSEITVTRRLFRSGESEYLIDGKLARLRDIQDIFMGTGLGPECYAIIEQGRIGQILSSKPQDRRAVIEEAAGITKFKSKRRLAEAKLEGAKQNLTRVFDILEEVSRQVNSLKRQAAKARRCEELRTELAGHLRTTLAGRFRMLERDAVKIALDLNVATGELQSLQTGVSEKEREYSRLQTESYQTEARLTEARQRLAGLQVEVERTRGRLEAQARQIAAIDQRMSQGELEAQDLDARMVHARDELEAQVRALSELEHHTEEARGRLLAKNEEREHLHQELREREKGMETARQHVLRLLGEAASLKNQLAQIASYLESIERDEARARLEEETAAADLDRLHAQQEELSAKGAGFRCELESLAENRQRVEAQLATYKSRAAEARRQLDQLRTGFSDLRARKDSLEEILSHHAYTTESVKRLFTAIDRGSTRELKPMGVLADFVDVDAAYEKAAEEFLHEELEYVVVETWEQAQRGIEFLRGNLEGRATFYVHPEPGAPYVNGNGALPAVGPETGISAKLSDVLRFSNGLAKASMHGLPRISRCYLVEEHGTAQRLAQQYPGAFFLLPDGVCYHGQAVSGGKKSGSGPLALKRELRELTNTVAQKQRELDETAETLKSLDEEVVVLGEELERLRSSQQNLEKEALAVEHESRKVREEHARASSRLTVAQVELQRLNQEAQRSVEKRERSLFQVEEKEAARAEQEELLQEDRHELERLNTETARVSEEHSALRVELAEMEERRRAGRGALTRLEGHSRELSNRRQALAEEMEKKGIERARLLADNIELDSRAALLAGEVTQAQADVDRLAEEEAKLRAALTELDETLKQLRVQVQEAHEKRSQTELELVKRQSELKYLEETCRKELSISLQDLTQSQEGEIDEMALTEAEENYKRVKDKIEALGPVNPQALEEFQEAQQRYDFLNTQRQDLIDSIRDTEKAIQDIDVESRKKFSEAFQAINANFRGMFQTLFGGGIGEMRLTDEANVFDSGIDIVASPPGKRLQNVLLLSGGEKALTALALLMAVFQFQPSPFCILDEVDAPLDEPNIGRLMRLLKEMSRQTQFILITHSKKTMEAAQILYGVTMQEPGVSRLVSVKFQALMSPPEMAATTAAIPVA